MAKPDDGDEGEDNRRGEDRERDATGAPASGVQLSDRRVLRTGLFDRLRDTGAEAGGWQVEPLDCVEVDVTCRAGVTPPS